MNKYNKYEESLIELGLKPQEAAVYLACLRLGQATVGKIADEANVQRTFVYDILDDLHKMGIASSVQMSGKMNFSVISVEQFKKIQEKKIRKFEALVPELKAFEIIVGDRPKVKFFEGKEGIMTALYDTLNLPRESEILAYATGKGLYEQEPEFAIQYIRDRVKKDINSRTIAPDTAGTRKYTDEDKKQRRITRLVPANQFDFTNEINIYGNKTLIMSMSGEFLAVIIESESVAKTQRMIFELAWLGASKVRN